ncbi:MULTISPECIES: BCCT family transporter [unclassified Shewanella]|uniref:BCCT family transporter n=1 Tax=unclassified Shewanella TaxID=196818 RepID=UPI000C8187B6|nr:MULTISPECIES: BCCT family transporter [unclassified Shewanella]MDO6620562.1 BCCT family transporter [Shewanella sp. 6_MG-2023]MDO6641495.1 BCCT family transporter [Shewanella sp. 5_MG-2023]MDO6680551.1 BCCT family transporter [Shewanella sp. 4_MG-2023]MDO6776718.1 BCCT family transporter [Shewanella sp. 3_MG-2023]PMG28266.1 choline transporter [Shewanella sp. 10N.286.52.C2]
MFKKASVNPPVFFPSVLLIFVMVFICAVWPNEASQFFKAIQSWLEVKAGWLYIVGVAIFLIFIIFVMMSRFGDIKLGPDHSVPDYSFKSWVSMLFSAGMGIGLMFFGVAEPVMHYLAPPDATPESLEAAKDAMKITFYHYGIHIWSIYAVVALSLAYFSYRHKLPLLPRSALYPLIGERIYGPIGHAVDTFAVIGTMFGVATSLGFGVLQVNSGLSYLIDGLPNNITVQIIIIMAITAIATVSVFAGLDRGVKRLSELNLALALLLLVAVLVLGPTVLLLQAFVQNTGGYLSDIVGKTFNLYAYEQKDDWLGGWTLLYWGWWISWSPFVGTFIARVSRGRTIREFLVGVLFFPTGITFLWMTVFGNSAIDMIRNHGASYLSDAVSNDVSVALFRFFEHLPFSSVLSIIAIFLVVTFFVTSSDSGSLVIDNLTSGGNEQAPVGQRVFWAILQGVVASVLLLAGGLQALQTAAIASAMPIMIVMLLMCLGLYKALQDDRLKLESVQQHNTSVQFAKANMSWEDRIDVLVSHPSQEDAQRFLDNIAKPGLEQVRQIFLAKNMPAVITQDDERVRLLIGNNETLQFAYGLRIRAFTMNGADVEGFASEQDYYRVEVFLEHGGQHYDVMGYTQEQIIADIVNQYERYLHYQHLSNSELVTY